MKKVISLLCGLALLASSLCIAAFADDAAAPSKWDGTIPDANTEYVFEGKGTEKEPWLIQSAADLAQLAANVRVDSRDTTYGGKFFKLTCDIDLDNHPWMGIGGGKISDNDGLGTDGATGITYFAGNFDGDYHKIYNLTLATTGTVKDAETGEEKTYPVHQQGLFGYILGARISNIGLESGNIVLDGNNRAGALVGVARCGFLIENCYNKVDVTLTSSYKGVYVGAFSGQLIDKWDINANTEKMTSGVYKEKKIVNCYNTGNLTATLNQTDGANEFRLGGIAAQYVGGAPELNNVYNVGDVTVVSNSVSSSKTNHCVGGITGAFLDGAYVVNTYFNGKVSFTATVANSETDLAKYRVGFLFGRCANGATSDSDNGITVGYLAGEGSTATKAVADFAEDKNWYGAVESVTIPLAKNSTFIYAPEEPEEPEEPTTTDPVTTEEPTTPTKPAATEEDPVVTTGTPETGTETQAPAEPTSAGCSSSIGLASLAMIGCAALGVGLIVRKKKHD